jgi:uncharacterized protein
MEPLYIPHLLNRAERSQEIVVDTTIPDFETLTPVRGKIAVKHGGTFLEVSARADTIVTLKCDRCLQQYNHRLALDAKEIIWLEDEPEETPRAGVEVKNELEDLVESLPPEGHFQPDVWLYEQLCLALPQRQLCNLDCAGIAPLQRSPSQPEPAEPVTLDNRWGILETLKHKLEER